MAVLRASFLILLTLLMTVTGIGAASARGQMAAQGSFCGADAAPVVLAADGLPLFDGAGDPVEARKPPCLDCTLGAAAPAPDLAMPRDIRSAGGVLSPFLPSLSAASSWRMGGHGRGPPAAA
ncbi:hypothetical protein P6F26_03145 [Roseibacterium sp. SDUM158017]|uniref:hypothetical protein n=1 Tax=Roseicyclus salinarum TaxID=3036773 RepID=UPI002414EDD3|nr:hypothetical protein [Roseibacterium sp. SDUM158017]MDG4647429.1 hypothetical protein [Roseibacterium sp. SDUM158017]